MSPPPRNAWTEFAIQTVPQAFPDWYDRLARVVFAPVHAEMAQRVAARTPGLVLDHGTGTGRLALHVARTCPDAEVHGVDVSDHVLMRAEKLVQEQRLPKSVTLRLLEDERWPFSTRTYDVIVSAFVLHCERRLPTMLFPRLRAGGRLYLAEAVSDVAWPVHEVAKALDLQGLAPRWLPRRLLQGAVRRAHGQLPGRAEIDAAVRESPFGRIHEEQDLDLVIRETRIAGAVRLVELHSAEVISHPE